MIDTHCHLTDPRLLSQVEGVLSRAAEAGVTRMVTIGTTPDDWSKCLDVCAKLTNVRCALGVHPNHCKEVELSEVEQLRGMLLSPWVCAIGEMGLDYHYDRVPKKLQREFFDAQLAIATALDMPVIVHSRLAVMDCLAVLKEHRIRRAVFHCFTGSAPEAESVWESGYLIGFTGVVTFKNAPELREIARNAPAELFLVETDAPYLSPEPFRGQKINEPALVMHTAQAVADARQTTLAEIDALTTSNALRLYNWRDQP